MIIILLCSDEHILTLTKAMASQPIYRQYLSELYLFQSKMTDTGAIAIAQVCLSLCLFPCCYTSRFLLVQCFGLTPALRKSGLRPSALKRLDLTFNNIG